MTLAALVLLVLGILLAEPVSRALAGAAWPARDPVGALFVWQGVGLAGGLALLGAGVVYGLSDVGDSLPVAVREVTTTVIDGRWPSQISVWHWLALLGTTLLAARLLGVLAASTWRTVRARRRHRDLLDVLATPWPAMPGARVLAHPTPVAYCLPGLQSRLVVSEGALRTLSEPELAAVLTHERTHLRERHDLVVLPFVAWGATAPFVPGMRLAQIAVATLVEMRADDVASAKVGAAHVTGALATVSGSAATAALTSFSAATRSRVDRIGQRPARLGTMARCLVRAAALSLVAVPTLILLFM